jgi:signal transduction histidine kinase
MRERKWPFVGELFPREERGAFKSIMWGLAILAVGVVMLYGGNKYIGHLSDRTAGQGFGVALYGAALCIFIHSLQVFLMLLGWTLIGQGAGSCFRHGGPLVDLALSAAGIWVTWTVLPLLSEYLEIASLLSVFFLLLMTVLFQLVTLNVEEGVDKAVAMLLWVCSFQSLELLPTFPSYRAHFSIPIFGEGYQSPRETAGAVVVGTTLFLSFTLGASLSTWLLAKYSIRLTQVRRIWGVASQWDQDSDEIRNISMVDMRNLVHDLKNPLAAVKVASAMLDEEACGPGAREKIKVMLGAIGYMERVMGEILHEDERHPISVLSFLESLERHIHPFSWGGEVRIFIDPNVEDVRFNVNEVRLMRALFGVLDNAWRANRTAGEKGIELRVRRNGQFLEIEILDNGPGCPGGACSPVPRSGWGSTGLGLAFARRVVSAHGGELLLSQRIGTNGASVFISLPVAVSPSGVD